MNVYILSNDCLISPLMQLLGAADVLKREKPPVDDVDDIFIGPLLPPTVVLPSTKSLGQPEMVPNNHPLKCEKQIRKRTRTEIAHGAGQNHRSLFGVDKNSQ